MFLRTGTTWNQQAYLKAPNAETSDDFGLSVAISGNTIVIGAESEDSNQTTVTNGTTASADNSISAAGSAYIFTRNGSNWTHQGQIKSPNPDVNDHLGWAVGIAEVTIIVGAERESSNQATITNGATASSDNSSLNAGAAYIFKL